jgi:hypothetical protein
MESVAAALMVATRDAVGERSTELAFALASVSCETQTLSTHAGWCGSSRKTAGVASDRRCVRRARAAPIPAARPAAITKQAARPIGRAA